MTSTTRSQTNRRESSRSKFFAVAAGLLVIVGASGCQRPVSGPMVISNQDDETVHIRVLGPPGTKEDFKVSSGSRQDLVTSAQPVRMIVAFDQRCDVILVIDFRLSERPYSAGGLISFDAGQLAGFVAGGQITTGAAAEPSRRCAEIPTPELEP